MAAYNKIYAFVKALADKKHNISTDQLKVALTNTLPVVAAAAVLADIAEIAYTNCSTRNLTTSAAAQAGGIYKVTLSDLTLTAAGGTVGPWRYAVVYNDTATNKDLVGFYDYGSAVTLNDGETMLLDLDQANGLFTLA